MRYVVILSLMVLMGCSPKSSDSPEFATRKAVMQKVFLDCVAASGKVDECRTAAIDLR